MLIPANPKRPVTPRVHITRNRRQTRILLNSFLCGKYRARDYRRAIVDYTAESARLVLRLVNLRAEKHGSSFALLADGSQSKKARIILVGGEAQHQLTVGRYDATVRKTSAGLIVTAVLK